MRIVDFLARNAVAFESVQHAPAYTAQQLARHLGLRGSQVAQAVLLRGRWGFLLGVVPASHQVDTDLLSRVLDGPVRLATLRERARVFFDCEWGVAPPFGKLYGLATLLDEAIHPDTELVFEAHTSVEAIRIGCRDFERLERPRRLRFSCKLPEQ